MNTHTPEVGAKALVHDAPSLFLSFYIAKGEKSKIAASHFANNIIWMEVTFRMLHI